MNDKLTKFLCKAGLRLGEKLSPRVGSRPTILGKVICTLRNHPPGPVYRGYEGEGADLRCRACGETCDRYSV